MQHSPADGEVHASTERAGGVEARADSELPREERLKLGRRERALREHSGCGRSKDGGERREELGIRTSVSRVYCEHCIKPAALVELDQIWLVRRVKRSTSDICEHTQLLSTRGTLFLLPRGTFGGKWRVKVFQPKSLLTPGSDSLKDNA